MLWKCSDTANWIKKIYIDIIIPNSWASALELLWNLQWNVTDLKPQLQLLWNWSDILNGTWIVNTQHWNCTETTLKLPVEYKDLLTIFVTALKLLPHYQLNFLKSIDINPNWRETALELL